MSTSLIRGRARGVDRFPPIVFVTIALGTSRCAATFHGGGAFKVSGRFHFGERQDEAFMLQIARHLTDATDGMLDGPRFLICDRDRKWSTAVRQLLETSGVHVIRTPFRAPNCNAHAERFVRSIKEECLNRVIPLGERHFRRTLAEFVVHYHRERSHQGLANELIDGVGGPYPCGPVRRRQRIGGLLNYYYRAA
jgi:transposase InsO family protein